MASFTENSEIIAQLEAEIKAQGDIVREIKANVDATPEAKKAEIDKLLALRAQLEVYVPKPKKEKKKKGGDAGGEKKLTKKQLRMLEREKKEAEAAKKEVAASDTFGDAPLIQSATISGRTWTRIENLDTPLVGQTVWVRGRMHTCRDKGRAAFMLLRQAHFTVQAVLFQSESVSKAMVKYATKVTPESVVDVEAVVTAVDAPIESATQMHVELAVSKIFTISRSAPTLPFQLDDAARPDAVEGSGNQEGEESGPRVGLDTRLNYRCIDLRTPANQAIMRIQSGVCGLFREFLTARGFMEMHTPKLLAGASEGGSSVFTLEYFGEPACLAQSPQFYKQMVSACAGFERVFEIGPVFRAENSNTHRHLCEFTGCDFEMVIDEHYFEVLDVFGELFNFIFRGLNERFATELAAVNAQHPFEPLQFLDPALRITFAEGIAMLREHGVTAEQQGDLDDLSTPMEKLLGKLVKEKYGTDFFIMDKYPLAIRPFYTMPDPENPVLSNSYDMFIRGEEIVSGAQRVHDAEMIVARAKEMGVDPATIMYYADTFRHGALPHAGGGIGLERVVMLFLGLGNIRKASMFPRDPTRLAP